MNKTMSETNKRKNKIKTYSSPEIITKFRKGLVVILKEAQEICALLDKEEKRQKQAKGIEWSFLSFEDEIENKKHLVSEMLLASMHELEKLGESVELDDHFTKMRPTTEQTINKIFSFPPTAWNLWSSKPPSEREGIIIGRDILGYCHDATHQVGSSHPFSEFWISFSKQHALIRKLNEGKENEIYNCG